ncbi:tail fiber assembly protein [Pseudomonas mosselii]|uniref:tail fiber assembly protein n=1 Tax=Pseudomonas mosselii TaxID=78327 RepID=UPI00261DA0E9|nr:tail fiber assembly protein [Pseudomonas mosselii]MDN4498002.1 tail fiber assembly protein [Pseudomonas mosselii]
MIIKLSPVRSDAQLSVFRLGDMLTINNVALDLARLPEGASLPASAVGSAFMHDPIERHNGKLIVTLRLPHAADATESARFPVDIVDPAAGPVQLPGQDVRDAEPAATGVIDWSQVITAEQKAANLLEQQRAEAAAEIALRRAQADQAIAPLQDAVDLDEATEAEAALLKNWKRYRVALNRVLEQPGYPAEIDWPAPPA